MAYTTRSPALLRALSVVPDVMGYIAGWASVAGRIK